ncbi:MAG: hypothetical protein R3B72_04175 [Polyangiaceae bacterium]
MPAERPPPPRALLAVLLVSGAAIALQVALTRIYAITLWHHFAYLVVGVALLGFGVAGAWLSTRGALPEGVSIEQVLARRSTLAAVASLLALLSALLVRPNALLLFRDVGVAFALALLVVLSTVPFIGAGAVISTALTAWSGRASRVYAADLVGAALGALAAATTIRWHGPLGLIAGAVLAMALAGLLFAGRPSPRGVAVPLLLLAVMLFAFRDEDAWIVAAPTKELAAVHQPTLGIDAVEHREWTPHGRIDVLVERDGPPLVAGEIGRIERAWKIHIVTQDGAAPTTMHQVHESPTELTFLPRSTTSAVWVARGTPFATPPSDAGARVLVIGVGGGIDVMNAVAHGASHVDGAEINPAIVALTARHYHDFVGNIAANPRVSIHEAEGRAFVARPGEPYDVIQLAGVDTFTALASGAYSLAEAHVYTLEAFEQFYRRLAPGGCLSMSRLILEPPRETLRLALSAVVALERAGVPDPWRHLTIVRGHLWSTLLLCHEPLGEARMARLRPWVEENGFRFAFDPERTEGGPFAAALRHTGAERARFVDDYPYAIAPAHDEAPFFFDYFRWKNLARLRQMKSESIYGAAVPIGHGLQLLTLLVTVLLAAVGILRPVRQKGWDAPRDLTRWVALYFAALGAGFLMVEVALLQRLTFFLGHPTYALTLVLGGLLFASGIGAALSGWLRSPRVRKLAPFAIALLLVAAAALSHWGFPRLLGEPLALRIAAALAVVALLGFALGMPFPHGIERLGPRWATLVPWAFAVNAFLTVVASSVAPLLAAETGFSSLFLVAAFVYVFAFAVLRRLEPRLVEGT